MRNDNLTEISLIIGCATDFFCFSNLSVSTKLDNFDIVNSEISDIFKLSILTDKFDLLSLPPLQLEQG